MGITHSRHSQELDLLDPTAPASHKPAPTRQAPYQSGTAPDTVLSNTLNEAGVIPEADLKQDSKEDQVPRAGKESSGFPRKEGPPEKTVREAPSPLEVTSS